MTTQAAAKAVDKIDKSRCCPDSHETWDFWDDASHPPALNMALDEALLLTAADRGRALVRFYRWDRPAVTIGYVQHYAAAPAKGVAVVRRPTGGGIVFHDHDFTYSVVVPPRHRLTGLNRVESYGAINGAVLAGLQECGLAGALSAQQVPKAVDRGKMVCFENPTRYDIVMHRRKIAGAAQRRTKAGILHQGSIHFGGPLPVARERLGAMLRAGFCHELKVQLQPFTPSPALMRLAERLVVERYGADAWNRRR